MLIVGVPDDIALVVNGDASVNNIVVGNSFNITCQPSCPTHLITWRRNGDIISSSSSTTVNSRFSFEYTTNSDGLVTRSLLTNNMAMLSDSSTYHCSSVVQGLETSNNITIIIHGKVNAYIVE